MHVAEVGHVGLDAVLVGAAVCWRERREERKSEGGKKRRVSHAAKKKREKKYSGAGVPRIAAPNQRRAREDRRNDRESVSKRALKEENVRVAACGVITAALTGAERGLRLQRDASAVGDGGSHGEGEFVILRAAVAGHGDLLRGSVKKEEERTVCVRQRAMVYTRETREATRHSAACSPPKGKQPHVAEYNLDKLRRAG